MELSTRSPCRLGWLVLLGSGEATHPLQKPPRFPAAQKPVGPETNTRSSWRVADRSGRGVVPELLRRSLAGSSYLNPTGSVAALCDMKISGQRRTGLGRRVLRRRL